MAHHRRASAHHDDRQRVVIKARFQHGGEQPLCVEAALFTDQAAHGFFQTARAARQYLLDLRIAQGQAGVLPHPLPHLVDAADHTEFEAVAGVDDRPPIVDSHEIDRPPTDVEQQHGGFVRQQVRLGHKRREALGEKQYILNRDAILSALIGELARLVCILFPELEKLVPSLHIASVYALLEEFPGAKQVANTHLTRLKALLETASNGHYKRDMALEIRNAAKNSIGSQMPAKSLELQHTIRLIRELDREIDEIEEQIQSIMDELHSPITTIPGLGFRMAAMILAEVGDFTRFDSPDKLLAYAGMSPSTYQSGQLKNCYPHMEKRGSRYLRYALYNATKYVCHWDPAFADYLAKKRAEGKHYNIAISHAAKKLVRLIFAMEKSRQPYCSAA